MLKNSKKILIIDTHPYSESLCSLLVSKYKEGSEKSGFEIRRLNIRDLKFDPILHYGYSKVQTIEEDLVMSQEMIKNCDHLVIVTPMWWAGVPALFKGFIDRTFVSGFSHIFDPKRKLPIKLLKGKTASVIYTQGAPFIYTFLFGDALWNMLKNHLLKFSGFEKIKKYQICRAKNIPEKRLKEILESAYQKGSQGF
jgi:NAD(P)H dehydrogenase (quinone)